MRPARSAQPSCRLAVEQFDVIGNKRLGFVVHRLPRLYGRLYVKPLVRPQNDVSGSETAYNIWTIKETAQPLVTERTVC